MGRSVFFRESSRKLVFDHGTFVSGRRPALLQGIVIRNRESNLRQYRYRCAGWNAQGLTQKTNLMGWFLCEIVLLLFFFMTIDLDLTSSSKECPGYIVDTSDYVGTGLTWWVLDLNTNKTFHRPLCCPIDVDVFELRLHKCSSKLTSQRPLMQCTPSDNIIIKNAGYIGQWSVRAYVSKPPQEIAHLRESDEWVCFKIGSPIGWIPTLFTKKIFTGTIVTGWKHHRPALQPPTAEKVYTDVGAEIGELEDHLQIIRKSRSLLKSIDIYVGVCLIIPSGKIDTIGLLFTSTRRGVTRF
jgi:hypothetical protein